MSSKSFEWLVARRFRDSLRLLLAPLCTLLMAEAATATPAQPVASSATTTRGAARGAMGGRGETAGESEPAVKNAKEALSGAAKVKREASGKQGEEKLAALMAAVKAYETVASDHAAVVVVAAEARFRAGEVWRTLKHDEDSRRAFTAVTALAKGAPTWAARAWLELGHADRRAKKLDDALVSYTRVLTVVPEQRRECVQALSWQGKTLLEQKNDKEGHATLLAAGTRYPEFPLDDIKNVDRVASDWIKAGRVVEARELLADLDEKHGKPDEGETEVEPAIVRALQRMKVRELLAAK